MLRSSFRRRYSLGLVVAAVGAAGLAAGCALAEDDTADDAQEVNAATDAFWGDDRVGAKLANLTPDDACKAIPTNYAEVESCFAIGRKCVRKDSQEVFVVEENRTRELDGQGAVSGKIFPRAVVTGCNTGNKSDPATLENSYSLMVGLFSPFDEKTEGDTLLLTDVEVMALDKTTGLFNFYVFGETGVTRVFRDKTGKVLNRTYTEGLAGPAKPPTAQEGQRCFGCHVNGAPLMNELADPWTNWVSFKKEFPANKTLKGTTAELVSLAAPNTTKGTSSFANDLEQTLRAAHCRFVGGNDCEKAGPNAGKLANGFGHRVLAGEEHGGFARLLKSVLCETELNYASATASIPPEVFFEPQATGGAGLANVSTNGDARFPFLFPVRSEVDKDIELFMIGKRILAPSTVTAIRVVDDENDIFSRERCDLWGELTKTPLPTVNHEVDVRVRDLMKSKMSGPKAFSFVASQPGRAAYLQGLLDRIPRDKLDEARETYFTEVRARFKTMKTEWDDFGPGRDVIIKREADRKASARKMFPRGGPLPVLDL